MTFSAWYRCIRGCSGRYDVFDVIYRCPTCGGLLEVVHDESALAAAHSGAEWRALFDQRSAISVPASRVQASASGVWAKHEWVLPQLRPENIVTLGEGYTPLLPSPRLGKSLGLDDLWVKQCGVSHTGSFKDLGMTVLVSAVNQMMAAGNSPVRAVACASTGDTSAALAAYAAAAGIPAIVFLPKGKISTAQLIQPIANGARVLALDTDFDGCMKIVQEVTRDNSIYLANSMNSLRVEGQKTVGIEIVQQLGWNVPDWIVLPSGNLGNISALAKGLALAKALGVIDRLPRLAAAQAARANPLYLAYQRGFDRLAPVTAGATAASAIRIGDPVSYEKAVRALAGVRRRGGAGGRERAGRRGRAGRPRRAVRVPAHRRRAGGRGQAGAAGRDPAGAARRGDLHRARAEVQRVQDRLPRGDAGRRGRPPSQSAGGAAGGCGRGEGGD